MGRALGASESEVTPESLLSHRTQVISLVE